MPTTKRPIEVVDVDTYNVPSNTDIDKTYMVWNSLNIGWSCECMWWTMHQNLKPPHPECKHIKLVKKTFIKSKV